MREGEGNLIALFFWNIDLNLFQFHSTYITHKRGYYPMWLYILIILILSQQIKSQSEQIKKFRITQEYICKSGLGWGVPE